MKKSLRADRLGLGVCYYPEQWDRALWSDDFARMHDMGLSSIRVGEFAWAVFEPSAGQFSFDLFDRALDLAHQHGLQVIFGTPTATPPAWLTQRYPEVLNVSLDGVQYQHGQRRHYNYNTGVYHELSARIVTRLAEHYRDHPAIVGWQIDNEINCEVNVFYAEADHAAFRAWLQERYGSLSCLNERWGAVFWSQTYTDWEQVHLTRPTPSYSPNPHQALDEKRFFSDSAIRFVSMQAEIIRRIAPGHWITTNGLFGHLDSHRMTEEALDFISYDSYPNFATIRPDEGPYPLHDRAWGWNLSVIRDISPRFCVMEQQSGPNGWVNRLAAPSPKPGQMRLWTYQSVAHGADAVLYFRWRTATMGTEIYWHGINDYHNQPNRRVLEVRRIGAEFAAIGAGVAGSEFEAEVAILKDYDNEWDGELDSWYGPLARSSAAAWYRTLQYRHIPTDVVYLREDTSATDLRKYKVLVYPHPAIVDDRTAAMLSSYVSEGGQLIVGCRAGYKDRAGHCRMQRPPGPLADLCGVEVEDFTLIGPRGTPPAIAWAEGVVAPATTAGGFNDILAVTSPDAVVLARYAQDYYAGAPVLVRNRRGAGSTYYHGAAFDEIVAVALVEQCRLRSPADGLMTLPREIELCIRKHPMTGERFWFMLNYADSAQYIKIAGAYSNLLIGATVTGRVTLEPYGVLILRS
jgi:beta-galactosidase